MTGKGDNSPQNGFILSPRTVRETHIGWVSASLKTGPQGTKLEINLVRFLIFSFSGVSTKAEEG